MSLLRIVFILNRPCAHARMKAKGRKHEMWHSSCFRLATRHVKIVDKNIKLKTWRVFAWRPVAPLGENTTDGRRKLATYKCVVTSPGGAKGRHANTRHVLSFMFLSTIVAFSHGGSPGENTKNVTFRVFALSPSWSYFGGFSCSDLSPRQAKKRQKEAKKVTHEKCRSFAWRPFAPPQTRKSKHLAGCRVAPFRFFAPKTR